MVFIHALCLTALSLILGGVWFTFLVRLKRGRLLTNIIGPVVGLIAVHWGLLAILMNAYVKMTYHVPMPFREAIIRTFIPAALFGAMVILLLLFEEKGYHFRPPYTKKNLVNGIFVAYLAVLMIVNLPLMRLAKLSTALLDDEPTDPVTIERKENEVKPTKGDDYEIVTTEYMEVPQLNLPIDTPDEYRVKTLPNVKIYTKLRGRKDLIALTKKIMEENNYPADETTMFAYFYDKRDIPFYGYTTGTVYYAPGGIVGHAYEKKDFDFEFIDKRHTPEDIEKRFTEHQIEAYYALFDAIMNDTYLSKIGSTNNYRYEVAKFVAPEYNMTPQELVDVYSAIRAMKEE